MIVNQIFTSLQGEGPDSGVPATFIRLAGCNVRCKWCDTIYASKGTEREVEEVARKATQDYVVITGGEPLTQPLALETLIFSLLGKGKRVAIETNGTLLPPSWWKEVTWDIDHKCPSSGVKIPFQESWLGVRQRGRVKFVVADEDDLSYVSYLLPMYIGGGRPDILISPVFPLNHNCIDGLCIDQSWMQKVWAFCIFHGVRFSLQIHKVVWGTEIIDV